MKFVFLTPGAGGMYCGNCLRDNALAAELNRAGHSVCMTPLYLPLTLDEADQSEKLPIFFGGINVYLHQKIPFWRFLPKSARKWLDSRFVLNRLGKYAARTQPSQVGDLTVSMLKGENGMQRAELQELCDWLKTQEKPDVLYFSNALLLGMHGFLKRELGTKTACYLTGEDAYLDALSPKHAPVAWNLVQDHAKEVDLLLAPSSFFAAKMSDRLSIPQERIRILPNGLNLVGFSRRDQRNTGQPDEKADLLHNKELHNNGQGRQCDEVKPEPTNKPLTLGFFARMSRDKGIDLIVESFVELRKRGTIPNLKLKIGGGFTSWNEPLVEILKLQLLLEGLTDDVQFIPNVERNEKIEFLEQLDVFSVPVRSEEAFGLYALEALAAGVPVVLPNRGAFPELIERTGGGILYEPDNKIAYIDALERLLSDVSLQKKLGESGQNNVFEHYSIEQIGRNFVQICNTVVQS